MKSFTLVLFAVFVLVIESIQGTTATAPEKEFEPCTVVIFGATGDLTARKLVPALYNLQLDGNLSPNTAVVGFARGNHTNDSFRLLMGQAIEKFSRNHANNDSIQAKFLDKIFYNRSDFEQDEGYHNLQALLQNIDQEHGTQGNRIYYLATSPKYFSTIIAKLHEHGLIYDANDKKWSKVIIEKPFGEDFESAEQLHKNISTYLAKDQIYLMDHYLGKEGVQNLLTLRFENTLFESLWNNKTIDNIQITLAEDIGIGTRANFWEETGSLRDVFQNHLMQLLALIAMEPPASLDASHIHQEKIKVLNSIRPFPIKHIEKYIIRAQYGPGIINGKKVAGYKQEQGVSSNSSAETFVAAKIYIDNPRWQGVPFYIRGGKRLPKQATEIAITFKNAKLAESYSAPSVLFIRFQPNASIFFKIMSKVPMLDKSIAPVLFGYSTDAFFKTSSFEAYEKLFYDCIAGDHSLFVTTEEQLAAWKLLTPVLEYWKSNPQTMEKYDAGTWGPTSAFEMLENHKHHWQLLEI